MSVDIKLHLGDCLEIMATLPESSVSAIITDLPYGTTACSWDEVIGAACGIRSVGYVYKIKELDFCIGVNVNRTFT